MARIYLDNCCLSRLFDVSDQERIRVETEAIEAILDIIRASRVVWVSSQALVRECRRNSDFVARQWIESILKNANIVVPLESHDLARARKLRLAGMGEIDALHLVAAEIRTL